MSNRPSVWITGVGTANALGTSLGQVAEACLAGHSGVRPLVKLDAAGCPCRIAAQLTDLPAPAGFDPAEFARRECAEQLFLWCAAQALRDAGWWDRRSDVRIGLVIGSGAERVLTWEYDWHVGGRLICQPDVAGPRPLVERVRTELGLTGPFSTIGAACASGNLALAVARRWLHMGWADICLAGGGDMAVTPISIGCFGNLGALSSRNDDPAGACRPFDRSRDGLVLGEGGALLVLEPAESARRRGARAYAEFAGFGASSDAFHMVIPSTDPSPPASAMRAALADARVNPEEIDYINAHATGTPVGDACEARAIKAVFGEATRTTPVSATKSLTGHCLSGAAAVDLIACLTALEDQALPPTLNLHDPDAECDLCHVPVQAQPHPTRIVISNSFGFGGSNTCLLLRKVA